MTTFIMAFFIASVFITILSNNKRLHFLIFEYNKGTTGRVGKAIFLLHHYYIKIK